MRESHYITTPFVTPEETADVLGVRRKRARTLITMVRESLQKKGDAHSPNGAPTRRMLSANSRRRTTKSAAKKSVAKSRSASRKKLTRGKAKRSH